MAIVVEALSAPVGARITGVDLSAPLDEDAYRTIHQVSNIREDGKPIGSLPDGEMMFHSDGAYDRDPYRYTLLYAVELPSTGGNTLFADMYGAYDTLPGDLKRRLAG